MAGQVDGARARRAYNPHSPMPVPAPRRPNLPKLIEELSSPDAARRESAAARLTIIGAAAVARLRVAAADAATPDARIAALRTLAGIAGAGATAAKAAVAALASPVDALAAEGIDVLRALLHDDDEAAATTALEHLTQLALSAAAPMARRHAALDALAALPDPLLTPILDALASDANPELAARGRRAPRRPPGATLDDVLDGKRLPDTPAALAALIDAAGSAAPVTDLRRAIDLVRARERQEHEAGRDDRRAAWMLVRGQLHRALADRDSHIALYDLRETLEQADLPLTVDFLAAVMQVGDESCLDGLAARWVAAAADRWLRGEIEQAVRTIVDRKALTRADPALVKLLGRLPAAGPLVAMAPRKRHPHPRN